jgi:hypothetical protein
MQAIINGEMYEIEPAVKVILDRVMTENAELKRENKRLEEAFQKATGEVATEIPLEMAITRLRQLGWLQRHDKAMNEEGYEKAVAEIAKCMDNYGIKDISTLEYILDQYQKVIVNITNGRMSYLTYPAETILSVASDIYNEDLEKAINDAVTDKVACINGGADNETD